MLNEIDKWTFIIAKAGEKMKSKDIKSQLLKFLTQMSYVNKWATTLTCHQILLNLRKHFINFFYYSVIA